jgi:hypothetical protein
MRITFVHANLVGDWLLFGTHSRHRKRLTFAHQLPMCVPWTLQLYSILNLGKLLHLDSTISPFALPTLARLSGLQLRLLASCTICSALRIMALAWNLA